MDYILKFGIKNYTSLEPRQAGTHSIYYLKKWKGGQ